MKRNFWNSIAALASGACLRFFFVLKFPAGSGDTVLYEQIATNWLKHHSYAMDVGGVITPMDIRMPGYPAFLAIVYGLLGKSGPDTRIWVMSAQVIVDLLTCVVTAALAATLVFWRSKVFGLDEFLRRRCGSRRFVLLRRIIRRCC